MVARPWIWVEPMRLAASTTPGQSFFSAAFSRSSAAGTAAPMRKPPFSAVILRSGSIRFTSTTRSGSTKPDFMRTSRSVPPASTKAWPFSAASNSTALSIEFGASYRMGFPGLSSIPARTDRRARGNGVGRLFLLEP